MNNHKITYAPQGKPCCGNCTKFVTENVMGYGWCNELREESACWEYCERWKENG
jgi:hypothetical protein